MFGVIFIFKRHSINCDKPALTLETWWFCFLYIILENINSREGLCPTEVQHYLSKIPPRQFSQAPHIASRTDVFSLCPTEDFHVKSTLLMLTVVEKKKSEFWHSGIHWECVFESLQNWAEQQQCPCLPWKGLKSYNGSIHSQSSWSYLSFSRAGIPSLHWPSKGCRRPRRSSQLISSLSETHTTHLVYLWWGLMLIYCYPLPLKISWNCQ